MAALESLVRYLELTLAACRRQPALHRHQIAVYERQLARARAAPRAGAYYRMLRAQDATLSAARAAWQDRHHNAACVHRALGDPARRRAAAALYRAGNEADFVAAVTRARHATATAPGAAAASAQALTGLLTALVSWHTEADRRARQEHLAEIRGFWAQLQAHDPGCTWARVMQHPPYRHRIPFDDTRLAVLGTWLAEALAGAAPGDRGQPAADARPGTGADARAAAAAAPPGAAAHMPAWPGQPWPEVPTAAEVARAYHLAHTAQGDTMPDLTRRLYEHVFALEARAVDGPDLLCALAEEGLLCRLARAPHLEWAEQTARHCAGRSQPVLAHHAERLSRVLLDCPTATCVEYEIERLDTLLAVDSAWDALLLHCALRAVAAVMAYAQRPGDARRETVRRSYRFACAFLGMDWDEILAVPRLWSFVERELYAARAASRCRPAWRGEVGLPLVRLAQAADERARAQRVDAWVQAQARVDAARVAARMARPAFDSPGALRDHLTAVFRQAVDVTAVSPGPPAHREVLFWGRRVHLEQLAEVLRAPPHPAVELDAPDVLAS